MPFKHGRYTAEAIARRREISTLIRASRDLDGGLARFQTQVAIIKSELPLGCPAESLIFYL